METLIEKYESKLCRAGLADAGAPLLGALDADLFWNRRDKKREVLERIFRSLNINSLLFSAPKEPYKTIIDYLCRTSGGTVCPEDCETRTFLHDLPVAAEFGHSAIIPLLRRRKGILISGGGIIACGTVSIEQAFITFSSICFAAFVKYFSDMLYKKKRNLLSEEEARHFESVRGMIDRPAPPVPDLAKAPVVTEEKVIEAIEEAGKAVVDYGLVDSYFGNISYRFEDTLFISQTSSSLDELAGCIDPCPLDGSSCAGITASSELSAHREIVASSDTKAILHGHPRFSVILSMDCDRDDCDMRGLCHRRCPEKRALGHTPIVPGEVGTGPFGLCNTVPAAIKESGGVIVYGHGVFTTGKEDFNEAFSRMLAIENRCREEYFRFWDIFRDASSFSRK